jgi:opacity protein-like surface antigen
MKINIGIFFLLIMVLNSAAVYSQKNLREGYVIKTNRDTINGIVEIENRRTPTQNLSFKSSDITLPRILTSENIYAYGYKDGNHFELKRIEGQKLFVECYIKGKISLYTYGKQIFVEKNNKDIIELKKGELTVYSLNGQTNYNNYRELLVELTKDEEGFNLPETVQLNADELTQVIKKYNNLSNIPVEVFNRSVEPDMFIGGNILDSKKATRFGFYSSVKLTQSLLDISGQNFDQFDAIDNFNKSWAVGGLFSHQISRMNKNMFINAEVLLAKKNSSYQLEISRKYPTESHSYNLHSNPLFISIPISIQYFFPSNLFSPYAKGGFTYNVTLNNEIDGTLDVTNEQGEVSTYDLNESKYVEKRNRFGWFVGLGLKKKVSSNISVFIESRAELMLYSYGLDTKWKRTTYEEFGYNYIYSPALVLSHKSPIITFLVGISF